MAIERSILQQLLYSRKKSELPNSKIERTNRTSKIKSIFFSILLTIFVVSTVLTGVEFSLFGRDVGTMGATSLFGIGWIKYFLLGLSAFLLFWVVLWTLHYRKLKKIKYKDLEADIVQDDDINKSKQVANLINKFIDEVLYFFECIDIDLVIFEDLDRLPTTEIFVKLRELNTIINNSAKMAKKVTFLYAVKDELFKTEEERAKFFEFILPIIPVINPNTSKSEIEIRLDKLTAINTKMELTGKFIKGISTYVPDMRILKNTFNDYIMMFHKIFEDKYVGKFLKTDNLFALCLYKNLFPYDYVQLEKNQGLIPLVIDMDSLKAKCLQDINGQIEEYELRIKKLQEERISSFEELKGVFIMQIYKCKHVNNRNGTINPWTITTFKDLDFSKVQYPCVSTGNYNHGDCLVLQSGEEVYTPNRERFIDVENLIAEKEANGVENIKMKISDLKNKKQLILSWGLADIVKSQGVDFCFPDDLKGDYKDFIEVNLSKSNLEILKFLSSKHVKKIDEDVVSSIKKSYQEFATDKLPDSQIDLQINFLRFLVAQNYIDEHFIEYTSNYKAEILSTADVKAVQSIQNGQINFNTVLENISEVLRWLDEDDFNSASIISRVVLDNIGMVKELSLKENDKKYKNLISLLSNTDDTEIVGLIQEYLNIADVNKCEGLLKSLIPNRVSLCREILSIDKLTNERKDLVLAATIKYSQNYEGYDGDEIVNRYISNHRTYLKVLDSVCDDEKVMKFLEKIKPQIKLLIKGNKDNRIQKYLVENNLYMLSLENLFVIYDIDAEDKCCGFYTKNYEDILTSDNEAVKNYIESNLDEYVSRILLNAEVTCKDESKENLLKLLTDTRVSIAHKESLLTKIKVEFADITPFAIELYEVLLGNRLIEATWRNIQIAYEAKGFNCVKDFIENSNTINGDFVKLNSLNGEPPIQLINSLLKEFNKNKIVNVVSMLTATVSVGNLELNEIDDNVLSIYIRAGWTTYNSNDSLLLKEKPESLCEYIINHYKDVIENFDKFFNKALPQICYAKIIACGGIDDLIKKTLLTKCCGLIKIEEHGQLYADYVLSGHAVPNSILWQFSNVSLDVNKKYKMLEICHYGEPIVDASEIKKYLMSINDNFKNLFGAKGETLLEKTESNKNLLDVLYDKKLISNYKKVRNKDEYLVKVA